MEILQILTAFFQNNQNLKLIAPIIDILRENNFDIKKALSSLSPQTIKPIIEQFSLYMNSSQTPFNSTSQGLTPISNIADKDIVYALNKYLSQTY